LPVRPAERRRRTGGNHGWTRGSTDSEDATGVTRTAGGRINPAKTAGPTEKAETTGRRSAGVGAKPDPLQNTSHPRHGSRPPPNFQPAASGQALRWLPRFVCLRVASRLTDATGRTSKLGLYVVKCGAFNGSVRIRVHPWLHISGALRQRIPTPRTRGRRPLRACYPRRVEPTRSRIRPRRCRWPWTWRI